MFWRLSSLVFLIPLICVQGNCVQGGDAHDASVEEISSEGVDAPDVSAETTPDVPQEQDVPAVPGDTTLPENDLLSDVDTSETEGLFDSATSTPDTETSDDSSPMEDATAPVEDTASPLEDTSDPDEDTPEPTPDAGIDAAQKPVTAFELAEHWAPVFYHDTDDKDYKADYITAFDFDGDFISDNNWENLHEPGANLGAVIYYSVISTSTHHFILYADFHPRDWSKNCNVPFIGGCHENDMEGAMVVVRRSDDAPMGTFELLYTEAHNTLHIFRNDKNITKKWSLSVESTKVTFEDGSHPELYVESKGHGVCALYYNGPSHCQHSVDETPPEFGGGDGVVYRYGATAGIPESGNDQHVPYKLIPIKDTLWERRYDICDSGCTFDKTFEYDGVTLPKAFDGDDYGNDAANPPWAWDDPADGPVYRGDFFFRPAHAMDQHVSMPDPISKVYLVNPFLDEL